jgi:S-(hydroxymethyl)glutathione dehydrogenase/alcohol dehydrogenase
MKAAVLYEVGAPLKIDDVQLDEPQANEILVKLVATGVCHTDLHFMKGDMPAPVPVIPGHEGAGIVEKVGPGVTTVKPGDHVIMMVAFNCGKCRFCNAGRPTMCVENLPIQMMATLPYGQMRAKKDGKPVHQMFGLACYAEKVVVHERSAVKIREDAPLDVVCLLGCGASTGIGTAINTTKVKAGETMAIFGCGGVGLAAVMGAKLAGAKVIAIDTLDNKLAMAKELGADYVVNAKKDDPQLKIFEILGGGVDYALEFIGNVDVMVKALGSIRPGGLFVVSGMAPITSMLTIAPFEFLLGKTITGAVQGDIIPQIDIPRYVDLFMQGKLPINKLITKTYKLNQINEAFEAMKKGEVLRGVIKF